MWLHSLCAAQRRLDEGMRGMIIESMLCWPSHVLCQGAGLAWKKGLVYPERAPFAHHPLKGSAFS